MAGNDINELKRRMQGALGVLKTELGGLRTGRASPHLLDQVHVDAYGQSMALNQVATVSVPGWNLSPAMATLFPPPAAPPPSSAAAPAPVSAPSRSKTMTTGPAAANGHHAAENSGRPNGGRVDTGRDGDDLGESVYVGHGHRGPL